MKKIIYTSSLFSYLIIWLILFKFVVLNYVGRNFMLATSSMIWKKKPQSTTRSIMIQKNEIVKTYSFEIATYWVLIGAMAGAGVNSVKIADPLLTIFKISG